MSNDTLSRWLDAAGTFPLLSTEQVIQLSRIIQDENAADRSRERAINRLIECNLRLVANIWRKQFSYVKHTEPRCVDLLQEGALGLRRAAQKFDHTRGYTFATYAIPWIRKEMSDYLRDRDRNIRISADCFAVVNSARKYISQEEARTGKRPSMAEIAVKVKRSQSTVEFFLERYMTTSNSSLNRPLDSTGGDGGQVQDIVPGRPDYCMAIDTKGEKLRKILEVVMDAADLTDAERALVIGRNCYGENPISFARIAQEHGMKAPWARNHYLRVMKRLTKAATATGLSVTRILEKA